MGSHVDHFAGYPDGDPGSLTCRHCGQHRQLTPTRPGRPRALVCGSCDTPDPTMDT